jgi:HNH endonuclease
LKEITLKQGSITLVDDEDFEMVSKFKWSETEKGHRRTTYARGQVFKAGTSGMYTTSMHRFVLGLERGDGLIVDHINGNGLDNRKCNLRICTLGQNAQNVSLRRNNKTGYTGVRFREERGVWVSEIRFNRKAEKLAYTRCKHLAALKYNKKAIEYFGEYAKINDVERCDCSECVTFREQCG